jgi:high-affinity nickel permease
MKTKNKIVYFIAFTVLFLVNVSVFAQCSMCRTTAESDLNQGGGSIAKGLNSGILYLMAVPYLVLVIGGYFFFKKPIDAKLKQFKKRFFPTA